MRFKFFAGLEKELGAGEIQVPLPAPSTAGRTLELVQGLSRAVLDRGALKPGFLLLKNGRNIAHLEGLDTPVDDLDVLSVFPMLGGG